MLGDVVFERHQTLRDDGPAQRSAWSLGKRVWGSRAVKHIVGTFERCVVKCRGGAPKPGEFCHREPEQLRVRRREDLQEFRGWGPEFDRRRPRFPDRKFFPRVVVFLVVPSHNGERRARGRDRLCEDADTVGCLACWNQADRRNGSESGFQSNQAIEGRWDPGAARGVGPDGAAKQTQDDGVMCGAKRTRKRGLCGE